MVFVCILIRTKTKVVKPWYGRSVLDAKISFTDVFVSFTSGVFDEGDPIGDQYETTQVSTQVSTFTKRSFCILV